MERRSESIANLTVALSAAQEHMKPAARDAANPFHESKYATLGSVWDVARHPLADNGLALTQIPSATGPQVTITTLLLHKSGEWLASDLTMTSASSSPQALGAAITYARRYSMMAMLGIAPEDDDAESAEGRAKGQTKATMKQAQQDIAVRKLRDAGLTKAVPPPIPPPPPPGAERRADPRRKQEPPDAGLGVGPHDINLEDQLAASIKQAEAKKQNAFKDMLDGFSHLKEQCLQLGRLNIYYDALANYGVKHANEFKDFETARNCWRLLAQMVTDAKGMVGRAPEQEEAEERQAMREQ